MSSSESDDEQKNRCCTCVPWRGGPNSPRRGNTNSPRRNNPNSPRRSNPVADPQPSQPQPQPQPEPPREGTPATGGDEAPGDTTLNPQEGGEESPGDTTLNPQQDAEESHVHGGKLFLKLQEICDGLPQPAGVDDLEYNNTLLQSLKDEATGDEITGKEITGDVVPSPEDPEDNEEAPDDHPFTSNYDKDRVHGARTFEWLDNICTRLPGDFEDPEYFDKIFQQLRVHLLKVDVFFSRIVLPERIVAELWTSTGAKPKPVYKGKAKVVEAPVSDSDSDQDLGDNIGDLSVFDARAKHEAAEGDPDLQLALVRSIMDKHPRHNDHEASSSSSAAATIGEITVRPEGWECSACSRKNPRLNVMWTDCDHVICGRCLFTDLARKPRDKTELECPVQGCTQTMPVASLWDLVKQHWDEAASRQSSPWSRA